jgi:hypothetical protein
MADGQNTAPVLLFLGEREVILRSESMHALLRMAQRVAASKAAVLITGETGSGKEILARAIHQFSPRAAMPWVDVNCAALPEHLIESELFGYEKGAFSGADAPKQGLFELADGGTLFLDEIGELEPAMQVKLLRVLDGTPHFRLGGNRKMTVDVRIVAATNQDFEKAIRVGRFRADLYHRLAQFQLRVPPLRERPDDVVALAEYFLQRHLPATHFSKAALDALRRYPWPGNVRELRNAVLQTAMANPTGEVGCGDLPKEIVGGFGADAAPLPSDLGAMEKEMVFQALARTQGHQGKAAEYLGISRRTLIRKLKGYRDGAARPQRQPLGTLSREQSEYFRAEVKTSVSVLTESGKQLTLTTVNISSSGLGVLGIGDSTSLRGRLELQFCLPGSSQVVKRGGTLTWAGAGGRGGINFLPPAPDARDELLNWLAWRQTEEGWKAHPALPLHRPALLLP